MKIDFRKVNIKLVDDSETTIDLTYDLGNMLYMQGTNIEECELGHKIYHEGEVELTDKQVEIIKNYANNFKYIIKTALLNMLM